MKDHFICCQAVACGTVFVQIARAGFKTVGAHGQDIFRGDVSCQTHFFRGGGGGAVKIWLGKNYTTEIKIS